MLSTPTSSVSSATGLSADSTSSTDERAFLIQRLRELGIANRQQARFLDSRAPEVLYSGAFGAGKSRILCEKAHKLALQYPGAPIAVVRKVKASLAATTKITYVRDVLRPSGERFRQNKTEDWIEYANGSRVWFFGLDADPETGIPSKVGSFDAAFIFVDEAVELDESDWIMLLGRLRYPGVDWHQISAATNPGDPNHWLIRRFTPPTERRHYIHASTFDNLLLPADYLELMGEMTGLHRARYAEGQWVAVEGALWGPDDFYYREPPSAYRAGSLQWDLPRVVVAVDPAATATKRSDETGIVVCAKGSDGRGYVLDDLSGRFSPDEWGQRAVNAYIDHKADLIVGETNNGGDMVEAVIRAIDSTVNYKGVNASRGKRVRAAPIAALYKKRQIDHVRRFEKLETQCCGFNPESNVSPDRMDAMVWGFTELLLDGTKTISGPFMVNV